jgi:glycerol-3-phosphate dehydrogenase
MIWDADWRLQTWAELDRPWDVIIIGGGITGAGILREAARLGLRTLLVEARDFAWGASSRSSKLVHGGFRYLKNAQLKLTLEAVHEREKLLKEGRGLINQLGFLLAGYGGDHLPVWVFGAGLALYDLLALKWNHRYYDALDIHELCPPICTEQLCGGYRFFDAQTDDARLVFRILREAVGAGGVALNYARAAGLLRTSDGQVCGIILHNTTPSMPSVTAEIQAKVVINASGVWADEIRSMLGGRERLRKLRGSHLIFSAKRVPLTRAISFLHPRDRRPVFFLPWEGVTLLGTTDVDHQAGLDCDPSISAGEQEYLLEAANRIFPCLELSASDIQATFSGLRPVIGTGKSDPSKESREHVLWQENGLLTITGGKLTTFRLMAHAALRALASRLGKRVTRGANQRVLDIPPAEDALQASLEAALPGATRMRLLGRYGASAASLVECAGPGEIAPIEASACLWAELRWAARAEAVEHLDDLLLRRTRLGLLLPGGGCSQIEQIRRVVLPELGWDEPRWYQEVHRYGQLWQASFAPKI